MPISLLELSERQSSHLSGLLSIVNPALGMIELRVVGALCGDQDRHRAIADEFAEAAFGFEHTAAVQRSTMMPFCQRLTRRPISRTGRTGSRLG
jgi:hypothetical protein